jgi:hypothetical protein
MKKIAAFLIFFVGIILLLSEPTIETNWLLNFVMVKILGLILIAISYKTIYDKRKIKHLS